MSQVTEQSVRFKTALASFKLIKASAVLDLTVDVLVFLQSIKYLKVTEKAVHFYTVFSSMKLIQSSSFLDLTEDDFDFLTSNKVWIATDRSRARRCVEACVYGTLDFVGYPRFPAPVEFIAAVIAYY